MGNRASAVSSSTEQFEESYESYGSDEAEKMERKKDVDWSDESSVHHYSAINCLHNYALGKMAEEGLKKITSDDGEKRSYRKSDLSKSLTFAESLEETIIISSRDGHIDEHASSDSSDDQLP
mmetsp:Transcript_20275/g.56160  ORF Transcript_20275/g.56160 Transcript_20275/m.56160 type:complete len:122 (-) Transcript_20275:205-570(-)|eukprot:CAMPEP_0113715674 /NCGR_PEP_ID=MMETSP0038_2-20120614/33413_1 /TAXON_ID=2898 /ORGANISM="Cryptomonas paramecium" /LENGTH=121 /DNA_ID=CAMNT_0000643007 /DNA_START=58 /DNA_END=423 /DNA_ORIENTATION=- /assembly_acc=CAM_ASM_000170